MKNVPLKISLFMLVTTLFAFILVTPFLTGKIQTIQEENTELKKTIYYLQNRNADTILIYRNP